MVDKLEIFLIDNIKTSNTMELMLSAKLFKSGMLYSM